MPASIRFLIRLVRHHRDIASLLESFIRADDWDSVEERDQQAAHVLEALYDLTH